MQNTQQKPVNEEKKRQVEADIASRLGWLWITNNKEYEDANLNLAELHPTTHRNLVVTLDIGTRGALINRQTYVKMELIQRQAQDFAGAISMANFTWTKDLESAYALWWMHLPIAIDLELSAKGGFIRWQGKFKNSVPVSPMQYLELPLLMGEQWLLAAKEVKFQL